MPLLHTLLVTCLAVVVAGDASASSGQQIIRVAADGVVEAGSSGGSGGNADFTSLQAAVDAVPRGNQGPIIIQISPGTYHERITVPSDKPFITFRGLGAKPEDTVIQYDLNAKSPKDDGSGETVGTTGSTSVFINATDFTAENLTFANTTPRDIAQAVAIKPQADRLIFRNVRFLGWQDTLYPCRGRQYYKDCYIEGGVDFIFGDALAVFDHCEIRSKRSGYITAARTPEGAPFGYVFFDCRLTRNPDVPDASVYLGRPWRDFANVLFVRTWMDRHIKPEGWHNWGKPQREQTAVYREIESTGPGASPHARVSWTRPISPEQLPGLTPAKLLASDDGWDPTH